MCQMSRPKPLPLLKVKHDTTFFVNDPECDIVLLVSTHSNCLYGDCGRLVRQCKARVVDSLGLGITCLILLYYVYKAS